MIVLTPLLLLAQATSGPVPTATPAATPPPVVATVPMPPTTDWLTLPPLPYLRPWRDRPELSAYVRTEVRAGRCAASSRTIRVDLAVLVAAGGQLRRIVPRAIQCATVEQYASGLVLRMARGNLAAPAADTWYHTAIVFTLA